MEQPHKKPDMNSVHPKTSRFSVYRTGYFLVIIFLLIFPGISCNPEEWEIIDCADCLPERPVVAEITVKVSISNLNPRVRINVYRGRLEEEDLVLSDTTSAEIWKTLLPADEYYSITATYNGHNNYYDVTAIDGGLVRAREVRATCDEPCWIIRGNNFNLKLKY